MTFLGSLFGSRPAPHVRIATAADAEDLAATHAAAFRRGWGADEFERLLGDRTAEAHVVCREPNGPVVGFVLSHVVPPDSEILSIAVLPEARGRGHGRTLLAHHLGRLAARGVRASHLEVEATNSAALRLYRRLGYTETGRRKGYYATASGTPADAVRMRLDF